MLQLALHELNTSHLLARTIFRPNGEVLLSAGYKLTKAVIRRLPETDQTIFWVVEEGLDEMVYEETVSEHIVNQSTKSLATNAAEFRKQLKHNESTIHDIREVMKDTGKFKGIIAVDAIQKSAASMIEDVMGNDAALLNLGGIRSKDNHTFQHSVESAIVAIMLANKFGFNKYELEELAIGVLLMNTGYLVMPDELINREGRINYQEYCLLKEHPSYGFTILKENPKVPLISAHVSYQHHERQDGGGYPRRLKGKNEAPIRRQVEEKRLIHRYAEIAAVADTYVALTSPRPHAIAKSPEEVMRIMIKAAGSQLNKTIVDKLITLVPIYPVGARVVIIEASNNKLLGCTGVVAKVLPEEMSRPLIYILFDKEKVKVKPIRIDLLEHLDIKIQFKVLGS